MRTDTLTMLLVPTTLFGLASWVPIGWRLRKHPELKAGYFKLFLIWLLWLNSGSLSKLIQELLVAGHSEGSSPWWAGRAFPVAVTLLGSAWFFLLKGDQTLEKFPGFLMFPVGPADRLRLYFVGYLGVGLISLLAAECCPPMVFPRQASAALPALHPAYLGLMFPVLWVAVSFFLSLVDGWQWLSESYRFRGAFHGKLRTGLSGMMNGFGGRGFLQVGVAEEGLFLGTNFLFRLGHPPLLVPWGDLSCGKTRLLFRDHAVLEFKKAPGLVWMIPLKEALGLAQESGFNTPFGDLAEPGHAP